MTRDRIIWAFFSGATRGSARFVLERRLCLADPVLVAMEDAPGKPDPTGLLVVVDTLTQQGQLPPDLPVIYAGDTVADMQTIVQARGQAMAEGDGQRPWIGVGVLPPHVVAADGAYRQAYGAALEQAGASWVIPQITALTADYIHQRLVGA